MVWAIPRSIATTKGITIVFFSSAYLDVSVQRVRLPFARYTLLLRWVAPFGNLRINGYLHLPTAYRSLSRPSSPLRAKASSVRPFLLSYYHELFSILPPRISPGWLHLESPL